MTQESKINSIADALKNKYQTILEELYPFQFNEIRAVKCAIECQREKISVLKGIKITLNNEELSKAYYVVDAYLDEAQQVLDNLEKRLK